MRTREVEKKIGREEERRREVEKERNKYRHQPTLTQESLKEFTTYSATFGGDILSGSLPPMSQYTVLWGERGR